MSSELISAQLAASSAVILLCAAIEHKKNKKKRCWIKREKRRISNSPDTFANLELKCTNTDAFLTYLQIDEDIYGKLLGYVEMHIKKCNTYMREAISPNEKLSATLRFLIAGESYTSITNQSRLSKSFLCKAIPEVCDAIYNALKGEYLKFPSTKEEWKHIADEFHKGWQFPLCLGAMDGKHINFRALRRDGDLYRNYKGSDSIVLLALVDSEYRFIYTYIGCNGCISNDGVLSRSDLMTIINDGDIHFPSDEILGNNRKLPFVIVADDAFPLNKRIMKPYSYRSQNKQDRIFSYRLSRAKHVVEHAFGILENRFRVLLTTMDLKVSNVQRVVQACCVLHNFLLKEQNEKYLEIAADISLDTNSYDNQHQAHNSYCKEASEIREQFSEYFINEGKVEWQDSDV